MGSSGTEIRHLKRMTEESNKLVSESRPVAQPANDGRKKIVLGKSRDKTLLDESFSDAEIDAAIYSVTERSKFTGDKRLNLITALRRTLIGEITFTEAVSNYGICVTTFSPYIMKAREELRKIATHGDGICEMFSLTNSFSNDDRKHKRYQTFRVPEKWKGNHTALKNAILTAAREYSVDTGEENSSFVMSMALMDVLSGDCSLYRAAVKHQIAISTLQNYFENVQRLMDASLEDNTSTLHCPSNSAMCSMEIAGQECIPLEQHIEAKIPSHSCEAAVATVNAKPIERTLPLVGSRKRKPRIVRRIVAEEFTSGVSDESNSGEESLRGVSGINGFNTQSTSHSRSEHELEKRVSAYFSSRIGFKNYFFGVSDEDQLSKIKKVVDSVCQKSRMPEDVKKDLKEAVEMVIRSRVTVTAAAARTSISTGTIRPYVHEALQLLEQLSVSPSPERLLQKHSSLSDGGSYENLTFNETFDIDDVKRVLNELLEVSALDEDGRRKIFETVLRVFEEGVSASEACKMHHMAQTTICKYVRKCRARLSLAKFDERSLS
uniref:HTH psq-type domain-containing protein n=1 Tax=Ascaris lumbricoides TaxID=6252 RepID=A0A0M3HXS1_ASCLU